LFPAVVLAFGFSKFEIGILVSMGYLMNMIFQPITGSFSEKVEPKKLLALGISLVSISMFLFIVSSTFGAMIISVSILRIGSSFFHPVGVSAVSRTYAGRQLDKSMGFQSAFGNLGILAVFAISATIYLTLGWQGPFILFALLDIVTVATTVSLFPKTRGAASPSLPMKGDTQSKENENGKFRLGLPIFFIVTQFISGGAFAVFSNFGNLLLFGHGLSFVAANYLIGLWVASAFFGALGSSSMSRFLSRPKLLVLSYLVTTISTLSFALFAGSLVLAAASLLANGFFISLTYPIVYSELSAYLGDRSTKKGRSFGILFSAQIFGSSVLGFLGGSIANSLGYSAAFEIVAGLLLIAVGNSIFWDRSRKKLELVRAESL
jgi:DHA1 family multidrug resistance protein-like MFS transporter